jgi:hypothetical protein
MTEISTVLVLIGLVLAALVVFFGSQALIRKLLLASARRSVRPPAPTFPSRPSPLFSRPPAGGQSRATAAAHSLPGTKRHAMQQHIQQVGPDLRRRYGSKRYYQPDQVRTVMASSGHQSYDYDCYGYATYCSREDFDQYHQSIGESCDYGAMRQEICQAFDLPETGDAGFDALDVFEVGDRWAVDGAPGSGSSDILDVLDNADFEAAPSESNDAGSGLTATADNSDSASAGGSFWSSLGSLFGSSSDSSGSSSGSDASSYSSDSSSSSSSYSSDSGSSYSSSDSGSYSSDSSSSSSSSDY